MKRTTCAVAAAVVLAGCGAEPAPPAASQAETVPVERGELSALVSLDGILTYRARRDGSPYAAINQARGIYTKLPAEGDRVDCGDVLYRVDEDPVLLLCGAVPAYRDLDRGDRGKDVRQLNRNLRVVGGRFTAKTEQALERLQRARGMAATGALALGDAVFLPRPVRIATVNGKLGEPARPGALLARATSATLEVQVDLQPSQQGDVKPGDPARITLPGLESVTGNVERLGTVARTDDESRGATIPAYISLDDPKRARGLDQAPVQVDVTTEGVANALSVPVTALVGRAGGGFAVEVVRGGGRRELVAVRLGLFDTANGRVAVEGELAAGEPVVVPSL